MQQQGLCPFKLTMLYSYRYGVQRCFITDTVSFSFPAGKRMLKARGRTRGESENSICAGRMRSHSHLAVNSKSGWSWVSCWRPMRAMLFLSYDLESVSDAALPRNFIFLNLILKIWGAILVSLESNFIQNLFWSLLDLLNVKDQDNHLNIGLIVRNSMMQHRVQQREGS